MFCINEGHMKKKNLNSLRMIFKMSFVLLFFLGFI